MDAQHFFEHGPVERVQDEPVHRRILQPQPTEAVHRVGDVDQQRVRHREARVAHQHVDGLLGVVAGGARVPQRQVGDPVGVDVLGRPLELGEGSERGPRLVGQLVVGLQQHRLVGLDDQRPVRHQLPLRPTSSELPGYR